MLSALFAQDTDFTQLQQELTQTNPEVSTGAALGGGLFLAIGLVFAVISIIGMWKVFQKAGKPGWAAIIPIYNLYVLLQVAEKPAWWLAVLLLAFIPVVGGIVALVFGVVVGIEVGKRFGKSEVWGAILNGLLGIGYVIIGFSDAKYTPLGNTMPGQSKQSS